MKKIIVVILFVSSIISCEGQTFKFRNIEWGSTENQVLKNENDINHKIEYNNRSILIEYYKKDVAGYNADRLWYVLYNNKLVYCVYHKISPLNTQLVYYNNSFEQNYQNCLSVYNDLQIKLKSLYGDFIEYKADNNDLLKHEWFLNIPYIIAQYFHRKINVSCWEVNNNTNIFLIMNPNTGPNEGVSIFYGMKNYFYLLEEEFFSSVKNENKEGL